MGYTKVVQSGTMLEVYEYEKNLPIRTRNSRRTHINYSRARIIRTRSADSVRRAARAFRRIVRSNLTGDVPPALFTFTMYQKLSYELSVKAFSEFIIRLRKREGREFKYIAVPEFQKRGAVH